MTKGFIIYCISLFSVFCLGVFGNTEPIITFRVFTDVNLNENTIYWLYCLAGIFTVYTILITIFEQRKKNHSIDTVKTKHELEILDETEGSKHVIKSNNRYIFSYVNEENKKVTCVRKKVKINFTDEKPYLIKYANKYTPKGFLDFLFYTKKWDEEKNIKYELYLNNKR